MARFEVLIPASIPKGFDTTLTITAPDWLSALRMGLSRLGEYLDPGLLCRMQPDGGMRITDSRRQRTLIVRPLRTSESSPFIKAIDSPAALHSFSDCPATGDHSIVSPIIRGSGEFSNILEFSPREDRSPFDTTKKRSSNQHKLLEDVSSPTVPNSQILHTIRLPSGSFPKLPEPSTDEHLIERVLQKIEWVHRKERSFQEVSEALLKFAMELVPCESGAVLFPGIQGRGLHFAAARGPKAHKVMDLSIPMDKSLAGFCMREGLSLVIDDARQDPHFYNTLNTNTGYDVQSIICAPLEYERRVYGAMELFNRKNSSTFTFADLTLLSHISSHLAQYIDLQI